MMQNLSIVLVEDEPGDAGLIRYRLKFTGGEHDVRWVTRLDELDTHLRAATVSPDVILLDLNLPDSSGLDTISRCKAMAREIPIVVLTGHDDMKFSLKALEAGAQDYLIKDGVEADTLLRAIRYAIERHQLEKRLHESEELMIAAIEGGGLGIWEWNLKTDACYTSERLRKNVGFEADDDTVPQTLSEWMARTHPDDTSAINEALTRHVNSEEKRYEIEYRLKHKQGHWVWVFESGHLVSRDAKVNPERMVGILQNISSRKEMEEQLRTLAMHDPLTGLFNRRSFMEAMDSEYGRVKRRDNYPTSILMLDIDHFKRVNDTYGHAAGDDILKTFAHTIDENLRENDVFGRLGGEEFAILLPDTDQAGSAHVAEKVRAAVEGMRVQAEGETICITTSVGIAMLSASDKRPDGALARADAALYRAKQSGRNRVEHADSTTEPPIASA
ncbi:diguanylate cyclase [Halomonas llamarensis]|uniref:diguanylate cyclase n=1 Tax=Halomonas llamarensis TaxID=2945104 RepID=A0ABT0STN1_9GAMM|nr:diguanylate cyclase [Halomonas llamarensis]MCL7931197.1 diguanylate cyclase [Halomonas llamarensis]